MATIFIFHGIQGHPGENWFPWLKTELQKAGHQMIVPQFPHADRPELGEWLKHVEQWKSLLNAEAILVGHSLGSAFALRLLERLEKPVHATYLVAPVWGVMGNVFDPLMTSFTLPAYDWGKIRNRGGRISIFHSDNDPYISTQKTEELTRHLSAEVTLIKNGGHLSASSGFTTFEALLAAIQKSLL